jgi:phage gpG-like protein
MTELKIELSIDDLKAIQKKREQIAEELANGDLLARAGLKIERQAKMNWGHGTHAGGFPNIQTGRLRASITVQLSPERPVKEAVVGTNVFYAPFVEFGHKQEVGRFVPIYGMRQIRTGEFKGRYEVSKGLGVRLVKPFAPAYPFLQPALDQVQASGEMEGVFGQFCTDLERIWAE